MSIPAQVDDQNLGWGGVAQTEKVGLHSFSLSRALPFLACPIDLSVFLKTERQRQRQREGI